MAQHADPAFGASSRPILIGIGVLFGALFAAAAFLWSWFGTKVFFDMVAAGIAYCF